MSQFQGPGREGSKWQDMVPIFENTIIDFQIDLKKIMKIKIETMKSKINNQSEQMMKDHILKIYKRCLNKHKYSIKCCFITTFLCFIAMIGYPFGNLFGLIIPSKNNTKLIIIYVILLIVIEIIIVALYFCCHHSAHNFEHKTICLFINELTQWINTDNHHKNINLIYSKQILSAELIDHGKALCIYICFTENDKSIAIQNETENEFSTMVICTSSMNSIIDINTANTTNYNINTPLL